MIDGKEANEMNFIDTHNHVIPFVDDGAEDWQMALQMLREAEQDGIAELVCTPHVISSKELAEEDKLIGQFELLKQKAEEAGIRIKLHLGCELYVQPSFDFSRKITTLAQNGRYFLIEFPMSLIPTFVAQHFFDLFAKEHTPIIAHPERNGGIILQPNKAYEFVQKGALLQVTAGSLLGLFGSQVKNIAVQLMEANLVQIVASDAHDIDRRKLKLRRAFEYVAENWGTERANMLFIENPQKVIKGQDIELGYFQPIYAYETSQKSFRDKVRYFFRR